jgi:hypothetical protein
LDGVVFHRSPALADLRRRATHTREGMLTLTPRVSSPRRVDWKSLYRGRPTSDVSCRLRGTLRQASDLPSSYRTRCIPFDILCVRVDPGRQESRPRGLFRSNPFERSETPSFVSSTGELWLPGRCPDVPCAWFVASAAHPFYCPSRSQARQSAEVERAS